MHLSKIGVIQWNLQYYGTKEYVFPGYDIGSVANGTRRFEWKRFFETPGIIYSVTQPSNKEGVLKYTVLNTLRPAYPLLVV